MTSPAHFSSWNAATSPVEIEYSLVVIDEIRQVVAEGYQRLSRGGIDVGGVLYGTHEGRSVRVLAMREIACEHSGGPTFQFSENDRTALTAQLAHDAEDHRLQGLIAVGWFLSHTRAEITLTDSDLAIYNSFFSEPWQVTLVVKPGRIGGMRAGFFVRESDGSVQREASHQEFNFPERPASILSRSPKERATTGYPRVAPPAEPPPAPVPVAPRDVPTFGQPRARVAEARPDLENPNPARPRRWPWGVAAIVVVAAALAVVGLRYFQTQMPSAPIALSVAEREGQLEVRWDHASPSVANAMRGALGITDGNDVQSIPLTQEDLRRGSFTFARRSGDVRVRLELVNAAGQRMEEASRFLGPAPQAASAGEADLLRAEKQTLEGEVTRLRAQNSQQQQRIQQLERTLLILQTRLGIVDGKE